MRDEQKAMPGDEKQAAHEREFDLAMARMGIDMPAERRAGALCGFLEMRQMAAVLRQHRGAPSWPSCTFNLNAILRGE